MYVFPGGRLEAGETAATAAVRETAEETGIEVDPAALVPLTRWVTPLGLPSRFDARFFGALVPAGTDIRHASEEVAGRAWLRPTAALEAMAAGRLAMWQPTVITLQQLEPITDAEELAVAFAPSPDRRRPFSDAGPSERSIPTSWLAGIEGRHGLTRLVGREAWVVVNPGDPTDAAFDAAVAAATTAGATLAGIVVEDLAPEHHAGVELFARGLGLAVAGPPGANAICPYEVLELADGDVVPFGDEPIPVEVVAEVVVAADSTSGPTPRWADRAGRLRLATG
jgi:ADP-ribose pyrophosphatase YjhB (NUDIX family)